MASHDKMKHFFRAFYHLPEKDHNINLTPSANCQTGPEWLTRSLTPARVTQKESITIWSQFLTPQLFFAGFPGEDDLRTAVYMANAISRQFGLAQAIPSPYHLQEPQSLHYLLSKDDHCSCNATSEKSTNLKKEKTTTPLAANPPLRKSSGRLVGKKNSILITQAAGDDKDDTSNTSNDNLDRPVISQHNEGENENTSSSDKSVSKFSSEDDVDALSPSGQLAS
ncbi:hypothetical protein Ahy_B09g097680 [Arachis hypogaea]|uniref:Uncharacterized protein n=1 Tax=Arachis hypogaea TaxID=3818 RepID=A0A444XPM9_ARAHY|nr:hypothetical protein Ahy_B09g097680 [Arachis hypogaea]